jgi:hypothetical protein
MAIAQVFTPRAQAAAGGYDYGFPIYGFSEQEMDSPLVQNPYDNACHVTGCSDRSITGFLANNGSLTAQGQSYIDRAKDCFGVLIAPDSSGDWDVSSSPDSSDLPNPYGGGKYSSECDDNSSNWLRLRFFILDTETMNSMSCYAGNDQACTDIGEITNGTSAVSSPSVSGNVQQMAQDILNNSNVSYPLDASSKNGSTKQVLQALAAGKMAPVTCNDGSTNGITSTDVNPAILQMILDIGNQTKVGVNAITDKCHTTGSNHYQGKAVDFECQGVPFDVSLGDTIAKKYGLSKNGETCAANQHWHYSTNGQ